MQTILLSFATQHVDEIEFAINEDLKRIGSYCQVNELHCFELFLELLSFKVGKTEVMLFRTAQHLSRYGRNLQIVYQFTPINFVTECLLGELFRQSLVTISQL